MEGDDFKEGSRVVVRGHGPGVVHGVGCCGFPGTVGVDYADGTKYHCRVEGVKLEVPDRGQTYQCEECNCVHAFGEWPEEGPGHDGDVALHESVGGEVGISDEGCSVYVDGVVSREMVRDGWSHVKGQRWQKRVRGSKEW